MNYLKIYCALIRKAQNRKTPKTYTEKHHIFPVSIFGKNNKIVKLTAREHYIAHALLEKVCIKRYGIEHIRSQKMIYAFWCMNVQKTKNEYLNSRLYEASRIKFISLMKERKISDDQKKKLSERSLNKKWWNDGKINKHCLECPGDGWFLGRLNNNIGRVLSEESKRKISKANSGKKLSEEQKQKIKNELKSRKWWNNGQADKHCPECPGDGWVEGRLFTKISEKYKTDSFREKCKKINKGKIVSIESRQKMKQSRAGVRWWNDGKTRKLTKTCPGEGWVLGYNF